MHSERCAVAVLLVAASLGGCSSSSSKPLSLRLASSHDADDYEDVLERWTRHENVLKQLDTTLRIHATLRSPDFNNAYVAKQKELFALPAARVKALERELAQLWAESYAFIVVAATHDLKWNDFHQKRSQWRIVLASDDRGEVEPSKVTMRARPDPTDRALFPHIGLFDRLYDLRFAKKTADGKPLVSKSTRKLTLRFAGALGKAELAWRLR